MKRVAAVDVVRGTIMVVMALDHVRDFFGAPGVSGPALLALRAVDRGIPVWLRPALMFGKVPMFYLRAALCSDSSARGGCVRCALR